MKRSEEIYQAVLQQQALAYQVTKDLESLITRLNEAQACEARAEQELASAAAHVVEDG